jgi:allene oxide cyclase
MKTFLPLATVLTCALVAAPALAGQHFVVVERPTDEITTDIGAKGDSPGDLLTFANPVFDAANKTQVGTDQGYCVRIVVGKSWECNWTMLMKGGQITIEGPFMDSGDSLFVVTGGSGKYVGAAGQMKLHPRDEKSSSYDFTFDLR